LKHTVISFGLLLFSVLVLFQLAKFARFQSAWTSEIWIAAFSIIFLFIGIFLSKKLQKEKIVEKEVIVEKETIVEKEVYINKPEEFTADTKKLEQLNISKREYEVLQLLSRGLSNQQIADALFVSENTIKKHVASLFLKLDVERRTEAIRKAREIRLVG
jgi:DNA-binding NarL/FixJ family response regulator